MNTLTSDNSYPTRASLRRAALPFAEHQDISRTIPPIPREIAPEPSAVDAWQLAPKPSELPASGPGMFGLNAAGELATPVAQLPVAPTPVAPTPAAPSPLAPTPAPRPAGLPRLATAPRTAVLEVGLRTPEALSTGTVEGEGEPAAAASTVPDGADADLLRALAQVVEVGGSDLHITGNAGPTLRVDGRLRQVEGSAVWSREKVRAALLSVLTPAQRDAFADVLELDIALTLPTGARFRVNFYQQRGAIGAAFRLVPTRIKPLEELGVPDTIGRFAALPRGLVLVTGPTGSGKSTTLAALIDLVNRTRADHIVTVEDPIEFLHSNKRSLVNQREVGSDTHSFAAALRHVLRQDPDVILIGELRDLETISVALTAAETGHLVFATLHTQDAAQSIDRIIDVFPSFQQAQVRAQLAATLQGVVCQMLLRRSDGEGRVVATEVLVTTPAIANLIRDGRTHQIRSAMQAGRELGMHTADQRLAELVNLGTITHATAYEKAQDVGGLRQLIEREEPAGSAPPLAVGGVDFGDTFSTAGPTR
ncbi:twitching motility protein PilT [Glaciihabitans tibetensis]|uniref:Twitching motility protein PilT n=1 Tax=Glaciihabitans tibetensis TaxID=1266600 RepID=A0A2T0VBG0_9MICO|nr:PilT/PilU family type 4a pilus ATPase [Glaciihabitans tibetensis]PRY67535.1 twitching motility protein PilT [Glaciihabitans tibetensis]